MGKTPSRLSAPTRLQLRAQAEIERRRRQATKAASAGPPFDVWLREVSPTWTWDWPYQRFIQAQLAELTRGEINRLMLFVPPRHGKSEMVTVRYPVWRLEQSPQMRVIVGAYNQTLASKFGRKTRRVAEARFKLSEDRHAADDWETAEGGGLRAVGVGAGITGQGGNLIIIDDPVKNRQEAESAAYRERVWDWYTDDLYTRLEPNGAIILIQTRWHEDDLAGRILASDDAPNWTVICLPAEAGENDPLGRKLGQALCPERYNERALARIKSVLGSRSYAALYQQAPRPPEGNLAKREWFPIVDVAPARGRTVRFWDLAATERSAKSVDPDWTVGAALAEYGGVYYVRNIVRTQATPGRVMALIKQTAELDGPTIPICVEREGGASGKFAVAQIIRELAGYNVHDIPPQGDKVTRAMPFLAQAEAGNVRLVKGAWNCAFLDEIMAFPSGAHDDQADATAGAFAQLATQHGAYVQEY
jgi:predicted phage terminase large subunit-like protein